jgi:hypothetical protein
MILAMLFVDGPYRGGIKAVKESFVKLGSQGIRDYFVGSILFLMVFKKVRSQSD